jgi:N-carbamoyl-L-amino-acid hydrolase
MDTKMMDSLTAPMMDLARDIYQSLERHWRADPEGILRPAYSLQENEAFAKIREEASSIGMESFQDLAGNAYFIYPGKNRSLPVLMTGSHMDAVPQGGRWDGTAGVVAGLAAIKQLHDDGMQPEQDVVLVALRCEESAWFNVALLGSRFACGDAPADMLERRRNDTSKSLREHMRGLGLNPDQLAEKVASREPLISLDHVAAFLETHIQQAGSLARLNADIGIVTGIRGNTRCPDMITFLGEAAHTGSTLQEDRRDAALGGAEYMLALEREFKEMAKGGPDIVWSFPEGGVVNGSPTTVAARYDVRPEVRSLDLGVLNMAKDAFASFARRVAQARQLSLGNNIENIVVSAPAILDQEIRERIHRSAQKFSKNIHDLPSGATHDAVTFAKAGVPTGMIFIPHGNDGISHNPNEIITLRTGDDPFSPTGHFNRAAHVMVDFIRNFPPSPPKAGLRGRFVDELQNRGATPF